MVTRFFIVFVGVLLLVSSLNAAYLVRGGMVIHEFNGTGTLEKLGESPVQLEKKQMPVVRLGLSKCQLTAGSSLFLSTSSRSYIYFEGDGEFAVDRFEQIVPKLEEWESELLEATRSRMVLNFRAGDMIVDNRKMLESSKFLVQTPLGQVVVNNALWRMRIVYDQRKQTYDFTITCYEGVIDFTDLQGQKYTLYTDQRIAGAGLRTAPFIGTSENTVRSQEQMQRYKKLLGRHLAETSDLTQYFDDGIISEQGSTQGLRVPSAGVRKSTRRPIVIEYANEPDPVTPFRGELTPPTIH